MFFTGEYVPEDDVYIGKPADIANLNCWRSKHQKLTESHKQSKETQKLVYTVTCEVSITTLDRTEGDRYRS